jgi:hypothetical protein
VFTTSKGMALEARDMFRTYQPVIGARPNQRRSKKNLQAYRRVCTAEIPYHPVSRPSAQRRNSFARPGGQSSLYQGVTWPLASGFTMQTYAHVLSEVERQAAAKMDDISSPMPRCYQGCYQSDLERVSLKAKCFVLWCARGDSNTRPSGS